MYLLNRAKYFFSVFFILCCSHLALFVNETKSEEINDPMEIANPILTTKGINANPYEIKASNGIKKGDDLELFQIEGKLKTKNGIWTYLNADRGIYNQISGVIFLFNNVLFYTENNEKLISDEAIVDLNKDIITLLSNVEHINQNNEIKAEKSVIQGDFQKIAFFGNVRTNLKINN